MFARYFGRNFRPDTFFAAKIYFNFAKSLNYAEYLNRKRLSDSFSIQNKKRSNIVRGIILVILRG